MRNSINLLGYKFDNDTYDFRHFCEGHRQLCSSKIASEDINVHMKS